MVKKYVRKDREMRHKKKLAFGMALLTIAMSFIQPFSVYAEELPEQAVEQKTVTIQPSENGSVSFVETEEMSKTYEVGDICSFTVTPKDGFELESVDVTVEDQEMEFTLENEIYSFPVEEDTSITAAFTEIAEPEAAEEEPAVQELSDLVYHGGVNFSNTTSAKFTIEGVSVFGMEQGISAPPSGTTLTEEDCQDENIRKILYYGWQGKEEWSGFDRDENKGIVLTSLALSHYYNNSPEDVTTSYYVDMGLKDFVEYCDMQQIPDSQFHAIIYHTSETYQTLGGWKYEDLPEEQTEVTEENMIVEQSIMTKTFANSRIANSFTVNLNDDGNGEYSVEGNATFCLEPTQQLPPAGSYTATETSDNLLRAMLYYGYGGPGYSSTYGMEGRLGEGQRSYAYVLTHMALAWIYDGCSDQTDSFDGLGDDVITQLKEIVNVAGTYAGLIPSNYHAYTIFTGANTQLMSYGYLEPVGTLKLSKTSANPALTNGNSCYSLEGAEYGVYKDQACTNQIATLITLADGTNEVELAEGDCWVKELTAPKGFALDQTVYHVTVTSGQTTTLNVTDKPQADPVYILLGKVDKETNSNKPQGSASLSGAEFTVKYYSGFYDTDPEKQGQVPVRTWVFRTDEDGYITFGNEFKVSGDELFYSTNGDASIPLGTITIQETKAPAGYLINNEVYVRQITSDSAAESVNTYNQPTIPEQPIKGGVKIQKLDYETGAAAPQGGATLEGAEFGIYSLNEAPVYINGKLYNKDELVMTITSDENGVAQTAIDALSPGYYVARETKAPEGYLLSGVTEQRFTITQNHVLVDITMSDYVVRGDVELAKFGSNSLDDEQTQATPLPGVIFSLTSLTTGSVRYLVTNENGYADSTLGVYERIITDASGNMTVDLASKVAFNQRGAFPRDTYRVSELNTPAGYMPIHDFTFTLDEQSYKYQWILNDRDVTAAIRVEKRDSESGNIIPVVGTTFQLLNADQEVISMVVSRYPSLVEVDEFQTDETGSFLLPEKLQTGTYYLKEIKAPEGYLKGELLKFEITEGHDWEQPYTIAYYNEPVKGQIHIRKTDSVTGEVVPGAEYGLYAQVDIVTPDGTLHHQAGDLIETMVTDENGEGLSGEYYCGDYYLKELSCPDGYKLDPEEHPVKIAAKDDETPLVTVEVNLDDEPNIIKIQKINADTKDPLSGAKLQLLDQNGQVVDEWVTDGEEHSIEYLKEGTYILHEAYAPEGYLVAKDMTIEVAGGIADKPYVMEDVPIKVSIQKIDAVSKEGIAGAKLQLMNENGVVIDEWISSGSDYVISGVKPGKYVLHELEAPSGYYLAADMEITVEETDGIQKYVMEDPRMGGIITSMHRSPGTVSPGTPGGNISTAVKTGDFSPVGLYLLLLIGAAAVCVAVAGRKNKRRGKIAIFSLFVAGFLFLQPIATYAAENHTEIYEYTSRNSDEEYKDFEEVLEEDGKKYELSDISYEIKEKQPVKEKKVLTKTVESAVVPISDEYAPEDTITEDGITYKLNDCTALDGSEYIQSYTEQVEYLEGSDVPERRSITITDAQGNEKQIEASLTGEETLQTGEWLNTTLSITFSNYDTGVFEWQGRTIYYQDSAAPLQGYETELLQSVGADPGSNRITSTQWVGDPYVVDGITYRDAVANVQYFVPYTRATYTGTVTYLQYVANYSAEVEEDSTTDFDYLIAATATYTEQTASVGQILAVIGVGVAIVALLVVVILLLLAKQKKQQKNQVIEQPAEERSNNKWRN